jgi:hypothetical protein
LWPIKIFYGLWYIFQPFWYVVPRKNWQPWARHSGLERLKASLRNVSKFFSSTDFIPGRGGKKGGKARGSIISKDTKETKKGASF